MAPVEAPTRWHPGRFNSRGRHVSVAVCHGGGGGPTLVGRAAESTGSRHLLHEAERMRGGPDRAVGHGRGQVRLL